MNSTLDNFADLSIRESPPGKVEILQDLDLFYIKQLAHNFKVSAENSTSFCQICEDH